MKPTSCPACGAGKVAPRSADGVRFGYKNVPDLRAGPDLRVPTCDRCGEIFVGEEVAKQIDQHMERRYAELVVAKTQLAINRLTPTEVSRRDLERLVGVSAGYLSKLAHEAREPSSPIASVLMLLAEDPARVEELRHLWHDKDRRQAVTSPAKSFGEAERRAERWEREFATCFPKSGGAAGGGLQ